MHFSAAVVSTFAALAAAYTTPDYSENPTGNAIYTPSLGELVPEGKAFDITWDPTLGDKISLVLLRGPSTDCVPLETIVEDIDNTGSYTWTPSTSLTTDTTHYGILLVVEGTGAYQYSTQFGISNEDGTVDSTTTSASSVAVSTTAAPSATGETYVTVIDDVTTTICPVAEASASASAAAAGVTSATVSYSTIIPTWEETTTICPNSQCAAATSYAAVSPSIKSTMVSSAAPVSSTPVTAASATSTPVFNGAGRNAISLGAVLAGLAAVMFI